MYKYYFILIILISSIIFSVPLKSMQAGNLDREIGQMIMVGFDGLYVKNSDSIAQDIINERIGGVILFDYNFRTKKYSKNIKSPRQLNLLIRHLQKISRLYPLLIGIDYEGGRVNRLQYKYGFPKTVTAEYLGSNNINNEKSYYGNMANVLQDEGINLNFAPVVDVNVNKNSPAIGKLGRSFSRNPYVVIKHAATMISAFKKHGILCAMKHFPGHGSATTDTHDGFVDVSSTWLPEELLPYEYLIKNNNACDLIMVAHVVNKKLDRKGYPATFSYSMITKLLRERLGFKGVIITDDLQMGAISKNYNLNDVVRMAIQAGNDILLFGNQLKYQPNIAKQVISIVKKLIAEGIISKQRIDRSYNRITNLKKKFGIITNYNINDYDKVIKDIYKKHSLTKVKTALRVSIYSKYFLGRPYLLEPLGERVNGVFDQGPLYRTDAFDCVTFVDTIIALAKAKNLPDFKHKMIFLRYGNKKISYLNRTRWFIQIDWNTINQKNNFVRDITSSIKTRAGKSAAIFAISTIDKPNWYRRRQLESIKFLKMIDVKKREAALMKLHNFSKYYHSVKSIIPYLPINLLFNKGGSPNMYLFNQIPSGVVVEIVRPNWLIKKSYGTNLNVSHLGLGIRTKKGLIFRNASSITHSVMDISLINYLHKYINSKTVKGINIQKIM